MAHFIESKHENTKCHFEDCRIDIPKGARMYFDRKAKFGTRATCVDCAGKLYGAIDKPRKRRTNAELGKPTKRPSPVAIARGVEPTSEPIPSPGFGIDPEPVSEPSEPVSEPTQPFIANTTHAGVPVSEPSEPVSGSAGKITAALVDMIADLESKMTAALDESRVVELIKEHATKRTIETLEIARNGTVEITFEPGTYHPKFPLILKILSNPIRKKYVYIVGGAGGGKSHLGEQLATALGVPFYSLGSPQNEYAMSGYRTATGTYVDTQFRQAFEHGGLILIDEIDASLARAILYLNPALSNGYLDFPDGKVRQHKDFYLVCGANTNGTGATRKYNGGRTALDKSTLDRFCFIELEYDNELERNLSQNDSWVNRVQAYRKAADELGIDIVISPRASMNGADLIADGLEIPMVEDMYIWKGTDSATVEKIKATASGYNMF